ncbi:MAG: efflux RND transporter permease subunit [Gammaproteobacteria bacterium]|nr:efflux RND transporter permease subunit [Gammaproteobacteria bacterium]
MSEPAPLPHKNDMLGIFARHPVAANLLMIMMILAGIWGLLQLNTQLFPNFALDIVSVRVEWRGASAEDIEQAVTIPLEQELRDVDGLHRITSTSTEGISGITLEFEEGTDPGLSVDQVKERVDLVRNLPATAEEPEISRAVRYETVGRILVSGSDDLQTLRPLVRRFERELLDRGIAKISITGLPEEEIAIQVPAVQLQALGLSLQEIGQRVAATSRDVPVGVAGRDEGARQLRFLDQRRGEQAFADLPLLVDENGRLVTLGDVALIERRARTQQAAVTFRGRPAVEMRLRRTEESDSLEAARILDEWLEETVPQLPQSVEIHPYDERWSFLRQRIDLLLKNGGTGLVLIIGILFLFLNGRVAWWVTVGIPVSFMATLGMLYAVGGSINMVSLFALIMALGIIVDDAIVVGEDALTHYQSGESDLEAAEGGARRMLAPVFSSSLTTLGAFLPLMLVGGIIGNIMFSIPLVVICIIVASLVECFLILPGHLRHSFGKMHGYKPGRLRTRLDSAFERFRDRVFRPLVSKVIDYRWTTVAAGIALIIFTVGMFKGGRMEFDFFPQAEATTLFANVSFVTGTPSARVDALIEHMEDALWETNEEHGGDVVLIAVVRHGLTELPGDIGAVEGDHLGSIQVELTEPDDRKIRNADFIKSWGEKIATVSGIETLALFEQRGGPPGSDINVRFTGTDAESLKAAALELAEVLKSVSGVSAITDDMAFGREQLIFRLTPQADVLGLTVEEVGNQLRAAYDGYLAQLFPEGDDEIEVRVVLPDAERNRLISLNQLDVVAPGGETVPLENIVTFVSTRGFETLRHADGRLAVEVTATVDARINNANNILDNLDRNTLPQLSEKYGLNYTFEGRAADQAETLADMRRGALFALIMIYLVLAWVFGSYGWPLLVMSAIPLGLVGAVFGHLAMGIDLTILSLFGFVGLSGIVVNDSIILVVFYKQLRAKGVEVREAIINAACLRLRAVLLTSLTTIAGLTPLLFETSLQAQFLIPMATSIAFGLAFATVIVLLMVPSLLYIYERVVQRIRPEEPLPAVSAAS